MSDHDSDPELGDTADSQEGVLDRTGRAGRRAEKADRIATDNSIAELMQLIAAQRQWR